MVVQYTRKKIMTSRIFSDLIWLSTLSTTRGEEETKEGAPSYQGQWNRSSWNVFRFERKKYEVKATQASIESNGTRRVVGGLGRTGSLADRGSGGGDGRPGAGAVFVVRDTDYFSNKVRVGRQFVAHLLDLALQPHARLHLREDMIGKQLQRMYGELLQT